MKDYTEINWKEVDEEIIENLGPNLYWAAHHSKKEVILIDLTLYWDEEGFLRESYYINYIENHISHIAQIEIPQHPKYL